MKVQYKEMFPEEFKAALANNPLAYLPLGAMEWHGNHNVLGLDSIKANRICQLAAEKTGGVVLPALSLGYDLYPDLDHERHPEKSYDTYHIDADTYKKVLEQYFEDIFSTGFQKLFVLAGHYPNKDIAELAAKKFPDKKIWTMTEAEIVNEPGDHAGKWETSLMLAMFPDYVDISKKNNDYSGATAEYGKQALERIITKIEELVRVG